MEKAAKELDLCSKIYEICKKLQEQLPTWEVLKFVQFGSTDRI
jgi:hypothetical protein